MAIGYAKGQSYKETTNQTTKKGFNFVVFTKFHFILSFSFPSIYLSYTHIHAFFMQSLLCICSPQTHTQNIEHSTAICYTQYCYNIKSIKFKMDTIDIKCGLTNARRINKCIRHEYIYTLAQYVVVAKEKKTHMEWYKSIQCIQ